MKRNVAWCFDTAFVTDAAIMMRDRNVGFLPICSATGVVIGAITDRDIVVRVLAEGALPEQTQIAAVMTDELVSCSPDDDLRLAEDRMIRFRKSRIVCVDRERRLAGVISLSDIATSESEDHAGVIAMFIAHREAPPPSADIDPRSAACRDVMRTVVASCARTDRVPEIAALMRDAKVGFLPVRDESGRMIGALTDRDLVLRIIADGRSPITTVAEQVLTAELVFCSPDDSLRVAEALMIECKKSRVVCADRARHPVGVISLSDIARIEHPHRVARLLGQLSVHSTASV